MHTEFTGPGVAGYLRSTNTDYASAEALASIFDCRRMQIVRAAQTHRDLRYDANTDRVYLTCRDAVLPSYGRAA